MKTALIAAAAAALVAGGNAGADDGDYLLEITRIGVKLGHEMKFRAGIKDYMDCYEDADGGGTWSAWASVDGEASSYHLVSRRDNWAELDEMDEAGQGCWSVVEEKIAPHITGVHASFARRLPAWSGDPEDYSVVRLHNFRVDDGDQFEAIVGEITGIMKAADYEHMGNWYDVIGGHQEDAEYFVVDYFENFAAMDEDRPGAGGILDQEIGEAAADAMWDKFGASLEDDGYWSFMLRLDPELSRMQD